MLLVRELKGVIKMANDNVNVGFSKYNALDNEVVGTKFYVFAIDLQGHFHHLENTIKIYRPGSLYVVNEWDNEGKNLNLPCRFFPQAEYDLFPCYKVFEKMTSGIRMFGRDLEKLQSKWKMKWLERVKICNDFSEKFLYFADFAEEKENGREN